MLSVNRKTQTGRWHATRQSVFVIWSDKHQRWQSEMIVTEWKQKHLYEMKVVSVLFFVFYTHLTSPAVLSCCAISKQTISNLGQLTDLKQLKNPNLTTTSSFLCGTKSLTGTLAGTALTHQLDFLSGPVYLNLEDSKGSSCHAHTGHVHYWKTGGTRTWKTQSRAARLRLCVVTIILLRNVSSMAWHACMINRSHSHCHSLAIFLNTQNRAHWTNSCAINKMFSYQN